MEKTIINGEALCASTEGVLVIEQYLQENYLFRRNVLNGKVEYATKNAEGVCSDWRPLTLEAQNSIVLRVLREGILEKGNPKDLIKLYVESEEVKPFNPIQDYLESLPKWDGHNYVADLFSRIPGLSTEQAAFLATWLRAVVAHWLQMDTLHGNEVVPTLIGGQGCGKTTFLRRLLPKHLEQYYLDHLNLANKFDKEMALTNNLLVNLDELEAIRPSQQAALKQTLSKNKVNGRRIYGSSQDDRPRYASFVSSTNNPHPLTDVTGSRRYICVRIPQGVNINNKGDINYEQLYAQVLYELRELKAPYWFNNEEVARIQELNQEFVEKKDIAEMVAACFRKPKDNEVVKGMSSAQLLEVMKDNYPSLMATPSNIIHLGMTMKALEYEFTTHAHTKYYKAVPRYSA